MANKRSLNRVILIGTAGRDPEITHIPSLDKDVAKFSIATSEVYMDKRTNQFQETTEWHNIVVWGPMVKKVERGVFKGSLVLIEGKLKTRKWKDQNDQERRSTEIHADTVVSLEKGNRESSGSSSSSSSSSSSPYSGGRNNSNSGYGQNNDGGGYPYTGGASGGYQEPPEMQYDDINDIPYDDSDPF